MKRRSLKQSTADSGLTATAKDFIFADSTPPTYTNGATVPQTETTVPLDRIVLPVTQVRRYFDPEKLEQLTRSVAKHGVMSPILLRPLDGGYELVAGERRYRAARAAGLDRIPAIVREMTDAEVLEASAIENLQREDLNLYEETEASLAVLSVRLQMPVSHVVKLLYQMQNEQAGKLTHSVVSTVEKEIVCSTFEELGRLSWGSFVSHRLSLLKLPGDIKQALMQGEIEYTKAKAIAGVKDEAERVALLEVAISESLSLSQVKERVKALKPSSAEERPTLQTRWEDTYKRLKKSQAWSDPGKAKKLEKLLGQIDSLLD